MYQCPVVRYRTTCTGCRIKREVTFQPLVYKENNVNNTHTKQFKLYVTVVVSVSSEVQMINMGDLG